MVDCVRHTTKLNILSQMAVVFIFIELIAGTIAQKIQGLKQQEDLFTEGAIDNQFFYQFEQDLDLASMLQETDKMTDSEKKLATAARDYIISIELELQDIEDQVELQAQQVQAQAKRIKSTRSKLLSLLAPVTDSSLDEQGLEDEQNTDFLPQNFTFAQTQSQENELQGNNTRDHPLLKETSNAYTIVMNQTKNYFSVFQNLYIGNNFDAMGDEHPLAYSTMTQYTILPSVDRRLEYCPEPWNTNSKCEIGNAQCVNCDPVGKYNCMDDSMCPDGCPYIDGTYNDLWENCASCLDTNYFGGQVLAYQQQPYGIPVCITNRNTDSCLQGTGNVIFAFAQLYTQGPEVNTTIPGHDTCEFANCSGTYTKYGGIVGFGPIDLQYIQNSYMAVWSLSMGTEAMVTFSYYMNSSSYLSFGQITSTDYALNSRNFLGTVENQIEIGWAFQLATFQLEPQRGNVTQTSTYAMIDSANPYIHLPKEFFREFMTQKPLKNAFPQYDGSTKTYFSKYTCDYVSKTYCITDHQSLQFSAPDVNGDIFYFSLSPQTWLRPMEDGTCTLMVRESDMIFEQNGQVYNYTDNFILGLPYFYEYDIELSFKLGQISQYRREGIYSPVNIAICVEPDHVIVLCYLLSSLSFLWVFV